MGYFSREDRYTMLCAIKRGLRRGDPITEEEEQYIQEFAMQKVNALMEDPECASALDRLYESKWAHRFD